MTSDPPRPGLQPLSHLKAGPTTSRSRSTAQPAASSAQPTPRSPNRSPLRKNVGRNGPDSTSERVTTALIRRVLCPQGGNYGTSASQPPEELLPPLTSSNDVDHQLYAFIAVIVREFVYSWYSTITSDQALVNEALQVTAHCARALEQRLRHVDVAQLLLDEIPSLVETHITSYRFARQQPNLSGLPPSTRTVYHTLNPHPALSPVPEPSDPQTAAQQSENEAIYRQLLVHGMLAVLLPTEDLENACLRTLVGDLLADRLMGDEVSQTICEGWFLWDTLSKLLDTVGGHMDSETEAVRGSQQERLDESHSTNKEQNNHASSKPQSSVSAWFSSFLHAAYLIYVALFSMAIGLFRVASSPSPSRPTAGPTSQRNEAPKSAGNVTEKRAVLDYRLYSMVSQLLDVPRRKPWLAGTLALMQHMIVAGPGRIGDMDSVLDRFLHESIHDYFLTPTLLPNLLRAARAGLFPGNSRQTPTPAPLQGQGTGIRALVAAAPHATDQQQQESPAPAPATAPTTPASGGVPSNATATGASSLPSSSDEIDPTRARRGCAVRILRVLPRQVTRSLLGQGDRGHVPASPDDVPVSVPDDVAGAGGDGGDGTTPTTPASNNNTSNADNPRSEEKPSIPEEDLAYLETIESDILALFADEYCNKHLVFAIIELVLVRLLPELRERSVGELLEDRGVR